MPDLRTLLGDRYAPALQAAVLADNPDAIASAQAVGGKLGQLMYLSAVDRLDRVLTAVLPALLAERDALVEWHDFSKAEVAELRAERDALAAFAQGLQVATDSLRAERDALAAKVERVRALHEAGRYYSDHCDDPECDRECVELWVGNRYHADVYDLVCETCSGGDLSETDDPSPWPCPTIRALDEEPQS